MIIKADFPRKLDFLLLPHRYKVARGGRNSGKSWGFARALLILCVTNSLRILCTREIQLSIRDSVYRLLCDQIELMGLQDYYTIYNTEIRGKYNESLFIFRGLSNETVDSVKSFEGIDIAWIEEGQTITKRSLDIFVPTIIRKPGAEIWVTYNPDLESDPVHQFFTINPPPDCINVIINWRDNKWFDKGANELRLHQKLNDPDNYDNIWEGECKPAVDGAIYFKQIMEAERNNRIRSVPYDPMLKVHIVIDIGFNDDTTFGFFQIIGSELRMIDFLEGNQRKWDDFSSEIKDKRYNWGKMWLPHDGFAKRIEADGISSADTLSKLNWNVAAKNEITEISVEEGIKATRLKFHQLYIDKDKCAVFVDHIKRYRRHIHKKTEVASGPVHDDHSHAADMLRYFMINCSKMKNEDEDDNISKFIAANRRHVTYDSYAGY